MMYRAASVGIVELPMSRKDIADYLGLTVETVSKTLSAPDECGLLDFSGPFTFLNRRRLAAMGMRRQAMSARGPRVPPPPSFAQA